MISIISFIKEVNLGVFVSSYVKWHLVEIKNVRSARDEKSISTMRRKSRSTSIAYVLIKKIKYVRPIYKNY